MNTYSVRVTENEEGEEYTSLLDHEGNEIATLWGECSLEDFSDLIPSSGSLPLAGDAAPENTPSVRPTPGTWVISHETGNHWEPIEIIADDGGSICSVSPIGHVGEQTANARMLAASPEMADFIRRVSTFTGYLKPLDGPEDSTLVQDSIADSERFFALLAEGRALYAKATGITL